MNVFFMMDEPVKEDVFCVRWEVHNGRCRNGVKD